MLLFLEAITQVRSRDVHITVPGSDTFCQELDTCYTFTEFTESPLRFITSGTRIVFESGEYDTSHMQNSITVNIRGVSNVVIAGINPFNASTIKCAGGASLTFSFHNSTNIIIRNIKLIECSNRIPRDYVRDICNVLLPKSKRCANYDVYATLYANSVTNLTIANAGVQNSSLIGFLVINSYGYLRIVNSNLVDNVPHIAIFSHSEMWSDVSTIMIDVENCSLLSNKPIKNGFLKLTRYLIGISVTVIAGNIVTYATGTLNTELTIDSCKFEMGLLSFHKSSFLMIKIQNLNMVRIQNVNFSRSASRVFLVENSNVYMREVQFTYNRLKLSRLPLLEIRKSLISLDGKVLFANNSALTGGLLVRDTNINFKGSVTFDGNTAHANGGAIAMLGKSYITFYNHTYVLFKNNHAKHAGGAIFVENEYYTLNGDCFFNFMNNPLTSNISRVVFKGNTADFAGNIIFGGDVKRCIRRKFHRPGKWYNLLQEIFEMEYNSSDTSQVTTDPYLICQCSANTIRGYQCNQYVKHSITLYPGQTHRLHLVIVGKTGDTVPGTVLAKIKDGFARDTGHLPAIPQLQSTQSIGKTCKYFNFTVFSNNNKEKLYLSPKANAQSCSKHRYSELIESGCALRSRFKITLTQCPMGFILGNGECICNTILQRYLKIHCDINTQTIYRPGPYWIHADNNSNIEVHEHCPFDYCTSQDIPQLDLLQPDDQCANNRSGTLCGHCRNNLSLVLGSSQCRKCSNIWLLLLIVFAVAGVLLILNLTLLNLTVSKGSINGLIFFVNVIQANKVVFFPDTSHSLPLILSVFIAWLNLDLGLTTCFYNGMNEYAKNWLQFLFPAYIWFVLIVFIVLSNRYTRVARLCRSNVVSVLSTLFLLSYAKLLRAVITAISLTYLNYSSGIKVVWLYDGNVDYITGKHLVLFLAALLVLVVFSIPYTIFLLTFQFIQYKSNYKIFSWIHRITPLIDPYMAPYKNKHRYWTGLLLLFRAVIFLVFSTNQTGDPRVNNLAIILTMAILMLFTLTGGVYKNKWLNLLEWSHYLNLLLLSSVTLYILSIGSERNEHSRTVVSSVFIGTAALKFVGIVIYHTFTEIRSSIIGKKLTRAWRNVTERQNEQSSDQEVTIDELAIQASPTTSEVRLEDLEEPLLEPNN